MNSPLANSARIAADMRAALAAEFHLDAEDEAVTDTLEGLSDLSELIAAADREIARAEAHAEGLALLIKAEQARKGRLEDRVARLRTAISLAMQEAGFKKLAISSATLTLSAGKAPLIVDDVPLSQVPPEFKRVTEFADKTKIRAALASGEQLDFARLGNPVPTLTIRRG